MAPRTSSPPPSAYATFDDFDMDESYYAHPSTPPASASNWRDVATGTTTTTTTTRRHNGSQDGKHGSGSILPAILLQPLNLPRRALNSAAMQTLSVLAVYTICIATVWFMFCASFLLTFYDDSRRFVRTSRVWAQVKDGVRERLAMLGDWEEFAKRYFDQFEHGVDGTKPSAPSPGESHRRNSSSRASGASSPPPGASSKVPEPEPNQWWKDTLFRFMTNVAGQEATNRFQQTASSFRFRQPADGTSSK